MGFPTRPFLMLRQIDPHKQRPCLRQHREVPDDLDTIKKRLRTGRRTFCSGYPFVNKNNPYYDAYSSLMNDEYFLLTSRTFARILIMNKCSKMISGMG